MQICHTKKHSILGSINASKVFFKPALALWGLYIALYLNTLSDPAKSVTRILPNKFSQSSE